MNKTSQKLTFAKLPATYEELARLHMPRPIHDDVAYENTMEVIDTMAGHKLNADQEDYLAMLTDLVEAYDKENTPDFPRCSPVDALKYLLEEHDLGGDALARILGVDRSQAYRILRGERRLTADHIKAISDHFGISAAAFIG